MIKSESYLKFVREHPCLVCGVSGVDAHHPRGTVTGQNRGMGMKACGDDLAVPLCRTHHSMCHTFGDELQFWLPKGVDPIEWAGRKYKEWTLRNSQLDSKLNSYRHQ